MDVVRSMGDYAARMFQQVSGMKAFIVDQETSASISLVMSQTQILEREVFLVRRVEVMSDEQDLRHLRGVFFLRPTEQNIRLLTKHLSRPQFAEIHVYFSNSLKKEHLQELAAADQYELVRSIQEFYGDVYAINSNLFSLDVMHTKLISQGRVYDSSKQDRIIDGLTSVVLGLKKIPFIRYEGSSQFCKELASGVLSRTQNLSDIIHDHDDSCLLLIVDRREDPVTPLLTQWTYQAMLHELIGITNNKVDLTDILKKHKKERGEPSSRDAVDKRMFIMSDVFFKKSLKLNYGDLGVAVKNLVDDFQQTTKTKRKIDTIADMQKFVENYSQYMEESGSVAKHVTLMTEMSHIVERRKIMEVSAIEQSLACEQDMKGATERVEKMLNNSGIGFYEKLRVVMLFSLRYERSSNQIPRFRALLRDCARTEEEKHQVNLIDELIRFAGADIRSGDLYSNKDLLSKASHFLSNGLKDVENIYTQHQPLLAKTLDRVLKGKLRDADFPYSNPPLRKSAPAVKEVIVFIAGGCTYEEAAYVSYLNENNPSCSILLGGTFIHNSSSFITDLGSVPGKRSSMSLN